MIFYVLLVCCFPLVCPLTYASIALLTCKSAARPRNLICFTCTFDGSRFHSFLCPSGSIPLHCVSFCHNEAVSRAVGRYYICCVDVVLVSYADRVICATTTSSNLFVSATPGIPLPVNGVIWVSIAFPRHRCVDYFLIIDQAVSLIPSFAQGLMVLWIGHYSFVIPLALLLGRFRNCCGSHADASLVRAKDRCPVCLDKEQQVRIAKVRASGEIENKLKHLLIGLSPPEVPSATTTALYECQIPLRPSP